jgi:hypothetical protein
MTEAEVTRKVQQLERKRDEGGAGKAGRALTVSDWFETWLTTIAPRSVSQSTLDSTYAPKVRRWIIPQLGKHRLDRLQPEHLDAFSSRSVHRTGVPSCSHPGGGRPDRRRPDDPLEHRRRGGGPGAGRRVGQLPPRCKWSASTRAWCCSTTPEVV